MAAFADQPLRALLDEVAARRPEPGGGCSAAWTAALAAGLVEMAASFTLARPKYAGVHQRMLAIHRQAATLRREALDLAESDGAAYAPVIDALKLPPQHPDRARRLAEARSSASATPLRLTEVAAHVATLATETALTGSEHLRGDAVTGAVLAEGASRAAARLVEINLADHPEDPRLEEAAAAVRRASSAREEALRAGEEVLR
jgi:formiminotetrahydrofolate cyclodeaminase